MRSFLAALCLSALAGCSAPATVGSSAEHHTETACPALAAEPGAPQVFFAPFDPVEAQALCVLDTAEEELFVAHYNIRRETYLDKLVELAGRGVRVKVAVDAANAEKPHNTGDDFLEEHGIEIVRTKPPGSSSIMHLKVAVIDRELVMTGSFNWNGTAALANDENMVVLREPALAEVYRDEVLEVLGQAPRDVDGGTITDELEVHFSPETPLDEHIVALVDGAGESLDMAMFTFTSTPVIDAMVRAVGRGVRVRAVIEQKQTRLSDGDERLEQAGALVVRAPNRVGEFSAMHQKYAVIDGDTVITGATNWTHSGTRRNEEDLLVARSPELAAAYRENFGDLLHVYAGLDVDDAPVPDHPGVLFHAVNDATSWGDTLIVTGNRPELGDWDPARGIRFDTSDSMFPSWSARARLEPHGTVEYKFVVATAAGEVVWEPGANRVIELGRRSAVVSGNFGDTSLSWTPSDPP